MMLVTLPWTLQARFLRRAYVPNTKDAAEEATLSPVGDGLPFCAGHM